MKKKKKPIQDSLQKKKQSSWTSQVVTSTGVRRFLVIGALAFAARAGLGYWFQDYYIGEVYNFGELIEEDTKKIESETRTGFGGMIEKEVPGDSSIENKPSTIQTFTQSNPIVEQQLSDSNLVSNPQALPTEGSTDQVSSSATVEQPEVYAVAAKPTFLQKLVDSVQDAGEGVWNFISRKQPEVTNDASMYEYAKARLLAKEKLNNLDKKIVDVTSAEMEQILISSVQESQQAALADVQVDVFGNYNFRTNLEGVSIGPVDMRKAYKVEVEPIAEVDIWVPGSYISVEDHREYQVLLLGFSAGTGKVHYGDSDQAGVKWSNVSISGISPFLSKAAKDYTDRIQKSIEPNIGVVAIQLYKDDNKNHQWDTNEQLVPWAGVKVTLEK